MAPTKSQDLDGCNAGFFKQHWQAMGEDSRNTILHILNASSMDPNLNSTYIAFIAKTCNPLYVTKLRPISLCNVIYKLVFKVLVNRLKLT